MKAHIFGGELDISFVWKSLVTGCVCVVKIRTHVFNVFVSSNKEFVSSNKEFVSTSTKCVRVQRQKCLSLQYKTRLSVATAINLFVCSVISYLELNSRDYLVASDEHVNGLSVV